MSYSQILEVLLEFNEDLHVAPSLRYNLNVPGDDGPSSLESSELTEKISADASTAKSVLKQARSDLAAGKISLERYHSIENTVKHSAGFAPESQYISPTNKPTDENENNNDGLCSELGYLTPDHETEFYMTTDAKLGDPQATRQQHGLPEKPSLAERERELSTKSPASVYNWLKRNKPHVQQHDHETAGLSSEKSTAAAKPSSAGPVRSSKRVSSSGSRNKNDAADVLYDEDGNAIDLPPLPSTTNSKNKRKRDDDTYRPNGGGRSSRKKKKDDDGGGGGGGGGGSNGKRASKK